MAIFDVPLEELRRRRSIKWSRFEPDVLPMFVAEMDARLAEPIAEALTRSIVLSDSGYPEQPDYQEAFIAYAADTWGWQIDGADITLAGDVMQGMRDVLAAVTEPGDPVVINPPIYPPFRGICRATGREFLEVPLTQDGRLDLDGLAEAFSGARGVKPTAYLLCSPHNPNGTVHTLEELTAVARLASEHDAVVIADEIHAPLTPASHIPYLEVPGADNAYVVTSASKSWNLAAYKAGLIVAGPGARRVFNALHPMVSECASYAGIIAHTAALNEARDWPLLVADEVAQHKRLLADELSAQLGLTYEPSEGTYLAWVDCSPLGLDFPAKQFHEVGRVRFNLGTDFSLDAKQWVRINLAASPDVIREAVARMARTFS